MPLAIPTQSPTNAAKGVAYSYTATNTGGTGPFTWTVSAGALPTGLTIAGSTGVISGTPTGAVGKTVFTLTVTDSLSATAILATSITVTAGVLGSKTCTVNVSPNHTAVQLSALMATPLELMTVGNITSVTNALNRVPKGQDVHQVIGNLFI